MNDRLTKHWGPKATLPTQSSSNMEVDQLTPSARQTDGEPKAKRRRREGRGPRTREPPQGLSFDNIGDCGKLFAQIRHAVIGPLYVWREGHKHKCVSNPLLLHGSPGCGKT